MALTSRVDENRALRTCMQMFCQPADKIDRLTLIHLRLLEWKKKLEIIYDAFDKGLGIHMTYK